MIHDVFDGSVSVIPCPDKDGGGEPPRPSGEKTEG